MYYCGTGLCHSSWDNDSKLLAVSREKEHRDVFYKNPFLALYLDMM